MDTYNTVYNFKSETVFPFLNFGMLIIFLSIILVLAFYRIDKTIINYKIVLGLLLFIIGLCWTISDINSKSFALDSINNKTTKVIEGVVRDFDPMPSGGHKNESFNIDGVFFEYSDYTIMDGFNNTKSHGGPINGNGDSLRITYYTKNDENYIVKLEVKNYR